MALSLSPRLKLPFLFANQTQKEITVNEGLNLLDALVCATTPEWGVTAPPTTPANGALYVIPTGATGIWAGKANQISWYSEGWKFSNPIKGLRVISLDIMAEYIYDGTDWVLKAGGGGGSALIVKKSGGTNSTPTTLAFDNGAFDYAVASGVGTVTAKPTMVIADADGVKTNKVARMTFAGTGVTVEEDPDNAGRFIVTVSGGAGGDGSLEVALDGVAKPDAAIQLDFSDAFTLVAKTGTGNEGKFNVGLAAAAASAIMVAAQGTERTTAANQLDFGTGFTVVEKTGAGNEGKYTIAYTGAGTPLSLAVDGDTIAGAAAFKLNFGPNFEIAQAAGTPGLYNISMEGAPADITFKLSGVDVEGVSPSFMDFGPGFTVEETTPGYYAINFAGGSSIELAAGGVDVPAKDEDGVATAGNPVTKINFNGATVTPTDGGYMTVSIAGGDAADKTVKNWTTTPTTVQVDAFANQVVTLGANWAPQFSLAANHPGEKISGYVYVIQDATGGRTITWPGNIFWDGGISPVLSLAPNKMDIFYLETISDDALNFVGFQVGGNITKPATITTV